MSQVPNHKKYFNEVSGLFKILSISEAVHTVRTWPSFIITDFKYRLAGLPIFPENNH